MTIIRPAGYVAVEYPAVAIAQHALSIVAGLALLATVLSVARPVGRSPLGYDST
ncbi:hypothetical protein ACGFIE_15375 [Micromonospora sp. NPDC049275]|uniref:hypothetical protein n=1 Tax=Micromonospora sp. NPDC049275 TaxID=3364268 RepID=UPI00371C9EFA